MQGILLLSIFTTVLTIVAYTMIYILKEQEKDAKEPKPEKISVKSPVSPPNPTTIAGKTLKEIFWHPIAYAPVAALAVTNAIYPLPIWANVPLILGALVGEVAYWRKNWTHIYEKHECESEKAYREDFNERTVIEILPQLGRDSKSLIKSLFSTKGLIENHIFHDGRINLKEREILDLLEETSLQTVEAALHTSKPTVEMREALATMEELHENLDTILRPLNPTPEEKIIQTQSGLAQTTQALKNRMEESRQVRTLIEETKKTRTRA